VQKLLGILALGVAFALLISGTTGCNQPKTDKEKAEKAEKAGKTEKAEKAEKAGKTEKVEKGGTADEKVEFKKVETPEEGVKVAKKGGKADVKIELMGKHSSDVVLKVALKDKDGKAAKDSKVSLTGATITKDKTDAMIKIETPADADAVAGDYTVEVTADKAKAPATFKLKVE